MKTIFTEIFLMFLFTASSYSLSDSIIYLKETDFSLYRMQKVRYESTGESKIEKQLINLDDVSTLMFLKSDSLALLRHAEAPVYTKLANINDVNKYNNRLSPVLGGLLGAAGGAIMGIIIGFTVSGNDVKQDTPFWQVGMDLDKEEGAITGAIIGGLCGGVLGAVITSAINHVSLDLSSVPDKDKKTKLIKFLRQK